MELSDYAQALGAAQNLVPSYDQMRSNALAIQGQQLQNRAAQQEIAARDQAIAQQQQLTGDLANLGAKATPENYRALAIRYPSLFKPLSEAAGAMETGQRQQLVRDTAQIRATISAGKPEVGAQLVQRHIDADIAAGRQPDPDDQALLGMLKSGDQAQLKAASGILYATLASFDPDSAAKNVGEYGGSADEKRYVVGRALVDQGGNPLYRDPDPVEYKEVGGSLYAVGGGSSMGGGDPASSGAAGGRGDTSRLINTDAGGGYVPAGVQTLGQFVNFGRSLNNRGAKSSSAGTYQINGTTMAEFGPRALGADWKNAPYNADSQERVGEAIFNWAKQQRDPAAALRGRWVSLTQGEASRLVQGDWSQARGLIAQKETGGAPGASASAPVQIGGPRLLVQGKPKEGYRVMTPQENQANGLDPNVRYQMGPNGQITALGGQSKAQLKPLPSGAAEALITNNSSLRNIDAAISLLDPRNQSQAAKNARYAIGTSNRFIPDAVLQNTNPDGVSFRAQIGQIGGLLIKDISGAAVSASEDDRLSKWVPMVTDTPAAALAKLKNLRRELASKNSTITSTYSEDQGYRQPDSKPAGGFRILRVRPK